MISTEDVKNVLRLGPRSAEGIAQRIADLTGYSCDTGDVEDALDKLLQVREVSCDGRMYTLV